MIPKIIHQIWLGYDYPLPKQFYEWGKSWKKYHPTWEYVFWNNDKVTSFIKDFFPEYMDIYNQFPYDIQRSDAIRYLILWKIGGMYVDFDYECLEPFDDIFIEKECCFSMEPETHVNPEVKNQSPNFNNALMACAIKHPFMLTIIKEVFSKKDCIYPVENKFNYVLATTGPLILINTFEKYSNKNDIYLIPPELVSPFGIGEIKCIAAGIKNIFFKKKLQKAKAVHYFLGLWKKM